MTTINPAEILKYMSGAESTTGTGVSTSTTGAVGTFINSAWVLASEEATTEQKVEAGTNVVTELLKFFTSNAESKASAEAKEAERKVEDTQKGIESTLEKTYSAVQDKIDSIKELAEKIQENIEKTEASNEEKEEFQNELESHLEKLDEAQTIINNPESTKEEKQKALSAKITELANTNAEMVEEIETLGSTHEDLASEQVSLMDEAQEVLQNGVKETEQITAENAKTAVTATGNEVKSAEAKVAAQTVRTAAQASAAIPVAGAFTSTAGEVTAQKLDKVSLDQGNAASIRFASFANVGQELASTMSLISNNFSQYETFSNAIGSVNSDFKLYSSTFYSVSEPLGSWLNNATTIETQAEEIARVEETVAEQIENENPENESQKVEINTEELKKIVA